MAGHYLHLFAVAIGIQMIRVQTSASAKNLDQWAENYGYELRTIQSERGYIYDRWGHLLAGNKEVYEVGVELQYVANPTSIATTLASMTGADYNTVFAAASQTYVPGSAVYVTLTDFVTSIRSIRSKPSRNNTKRTTLTAKIPTNPLYAV